MVFNCILNYKDYFFIKYCASIRIVYQGGGRFQSRKASSALKAQSAGLCLLRLAHSQSSCADCPFIALWKTSR